MAVTVRLVSPPPPSMQERCRKHHAAPVAAGPPGDPGSGSGAPESKRSGPLRSFTHGSEAKNWPETEHSTEQTAARRVPKVSAARPDAGAGRGYVLLHHLTAPAVTLGVACVALFLPPRAVVHAPADGHAAEEKARARLAR
jgi:hypothetical protein